MTFTSLTTKEGEDMKPGRERKLPRSHTVYQAEPPVDLSAGRTICRAEGEEADHSSAKQDRSSHLCSTRSSASRSRRHDRVRRRQSCHICPIERGVRPPANHAQIVGVVDGLLEVVRKPGVASARQCSVTSVVVESWGRVNFQDVVAGLSL